jgi:hypothetical protein
MLRGQATGTCLAGGGAAAARWHTERPGAEPYFARPARGPPACAGFRTGDYQHEPGLPDRRPAGRRAIRAGTAGRSSAGMRTTCQPASGGCRNRGRPRANSRSSGAPDSSPHRSPTRSATSSA